MGTFSAKYKHYLESTVVRVMDEDAVTDAMEETIMQSQLSDFSITDCIKESVINGGHVRFEQMYHYAGSGEYYYGLPNAVLMQSSDGNPAVREIIEYEEGREVQLEYVQFRPYNFTHHAWKHLTEKLDYSHQTNEITKLSNEVGKPVYLDKIVAYYNVSNPGDADPSVFSRFEGSSQTGKSPTRYIDKDSVQISLGALIRSKELTGELVLSDTHDDQVAIHYAWLDDPDDPASVMEDVLIIPMGFVNNEDQEYYQAKYSYIVEVDGEQSLVVKYWTYMPDEHGKYEALNSMFSARTRHTRGGTYFPFVPFRRNGKNINEYGNQGLPELESLKTLLNMVGMDYAEMSDAIHANGDVDDIEQAVLQWGIPVNSTNQIEMEYLYKFFKRIYDDSNGNVGASRFNRPEAGDLPEVYALSIGEADYAAYISFDSIDVSYEVTPLDDSPPIGTYSNETKKERHPAFRGELSAIAEMAVSVDVQVIRVQVMETVCSEIRIVNPTYRFDVKDGHKTEGGASEGKLLIPLDYTLALEFTVWDRRYLYQRSMHFVFNSHVKRRVRWYETGIFKAVLVIVAIVVSIYTLGTGYGIVAGAFAAGGMTAAMVVLLQQILIFALKAIIMKYAFSYLVKELGVEVAFFFAVVAIAYGGAQSVSAVPAVGGMTANTLLTIANGLTTAIQESIQDELKGLQDEMALFQDEAESKQAELEQAQDSLIPKLSFDPTETLVLVPMLFPGEEPDDFFNRTIHTGNIGAKSLDAVAGYVQGALKLPTLLEPYGESN